MVFRSRRYSFDICCGIAYLGLGIFGALEGKDRWFAAMFAGVGLLNLLTSKGGSVEAYPSHLVVRNSFSQRKRLLMSDIYSAHLPRKNFWEDGTFVIKMLDGKEFKVDPVRPQELLHYIASHSPALPPQSQQPALIAFAP